MAERDIPSEDLFREVDTKNAARRKCKVMDILFERQKALEDDEEDLANIEDIEVPKPVSQQYRWWLLYCRGNYKALNPLNRCLETLV